MKPENEYNERQEQQKTPETQERMSLKNKKIKHGHAGNTGAENNELFASMPVAQAILTLAVPLFMFMTALANLFGVGGASLISRFLGGGERKKASRCGAFCI